MERTVFHKNVVIIGAGMAGMSAAEHLVRNGCEDVVVLEAQNRLGGRIHTGNFGSSPDKIVEFGANWIHGEALNNPTITLACELCLLDEIIPFSRIDGYCYTTSGIAIEHGLTTKLWELFHTWEAEANEGQFMASDDRTSDVNIGTFLQKKFENSLDSFPKIHHQQLKCVFNCLLNYERFHQGTPLTTIPAYSNIGWDCDVPGRNLKVKSGISKLITGLAQNIKSDQIKLNQVVTSINLEGTKAMVTCLNTDVYVADHVIVTVSLGVLKHTHSKLFQPPLPEKKQVAINSLSFGTVNKIYLQWERPFWTSGMGSIKLGWTDDEKNIVQPSEWYKAIFGFDEVLNNSHVLVGWVSGEAAEYVEKLPEKDIIDVCTNVIRMFLGNPSIPSPTNAICSRWSTNQFTRGSYSNVNYKSKQSTFQDLAAPILDSNGIPRILFAGEATVSYGYSTMNGARRSGLREAQALIGLRSNKSYSSKL